MRRLTKAEQEAMLEELISVTLSRFDWIVLSACAAGAALSQKKGGTAHLKAMPDEAPFADDRAALAGGVANELCDKLVPILATNNKRSPLGRRVWSYPALGNRPNQEPQ